MSYTIKLFSITFLIFFVCTFDDEDNPVGFLDEEFVYPIEVGNQWEYERIYTVANVRPYSLADEMDWADTLAVTMRIDSAMTILDSIEVFAFHEIDIATNGLKYANTSYYNNLEDGLYLYASTSFSPGRPKSITDSKIHFKGKDFGSIHELTNYFTRGLPKASNAQSIAGYEYPPIQIIKYPIKSESQWTYQYIPEQWLSDKKIISQEVVEVPDGSYLCYKIQWLWDMDLDGEWDDDLIFYDYVSSKGLIKRSLQYKDLETSTETGLPSGFYDVIDETVLTNINL